MKIPYIAGEYVNVYSPAGDVFHGPDSENYRTGEFYTEWVPNDFCVIRADGKWHLIGITHPKPEWFTYPESFNEPGRNIHEAEWQLFHAASTGDTLKKSLVPGGFEQAAQVLPASIRPNERPEIWAPHCHVKDGKIYMLYAPDPIRLAVSDDLESWRRLGNAFVCGDGFARDPNVLERDGVCTVVYIQGSTLYTRESRDLITYSEPKVLRDFPTGIDPESPVLKYIDGWYYLFYCIFDNSDRINGAYDYRTFVHAARTLEGLAEAPVIARLNAHAPEVFQDEDGDWYIASVEWPARGVNIARLMWK